MSIKDSESRTGYLEIASCITSGAGYNAVDNGFLRFDHFRFREFPKLPRPKILAHEHKPRDQMCLQAMCHGILRFDCFA